MSGWRSPHDDRWLLDAVDEVRLDARERALTGRIEQTQAEIDAMAAHLGELHEAIEHLRITRKTLLSLTDAPGPEPAPPPPVVFDSSDTLDGETIKRIGFAGNELSAYEFHHVVPVEPLSGS